ncbi:MAG TPA: PEP-CTERM sorting domain-containing protein [Gammaproteobacteria bacterium]|nr:PEP-CTERM sorting domain-containing protein [Gammaproteobacteria bacterium]
MKLQRLIKALPLAAVGVAGLVTMPPAQAVPFNQCPSIGSSASCSVLIQWDGTNFSALTDPSIPPYENIEDTLVGVQNNSDQTLASVDLTGSNIFGFDGDGIQVYGSPAPSTGLPPGYVLTGYEGPSTYFTVTDANNGTVNFIGGLGSQQSTYFSLEESPSTICPNNECVGLVTGGGTTPSSVPEPGTVFLFGAGLAGLGYVRKRGGAKA